MIIIVYMTLENLFSFKCIDFADGFAPNGYILNGFTLLFFTIILFIIQGSLNSRACDRKGNI